MRALPLSTCRQRYCLSVRDLAKRAEVSPVTVWRIEHNRHAPMPSTRRQIASALGLDWQAIAWPGGVV